MNWYPNKRLGLLWGLGLLLALLLAQYLLVRGSLDQPMGLPLFGRTLILLATVPLAVFLIHGYYGLVRLAYRVERNGIVIHWGVVRDVVPMEAIEEIVPFAKLGIRLNQGIGWPGYRIGQVQLEDLGSARLYITQRPEQCLLVRTRELSYLISPANASGFLADYQARRALGPIAPWTLGQRLPTLLELTVWHDRLVAGLLLPGALLNLALFGYLAGHYPNLPPLMVLSFGPQGLGNRIGTRSEIFLLPIVGLGILLTNSLLAVWVHGKERLLALLLVGNVTVVQALIWLAATQLTG